MPGGLPIYRMSQKQVCSGVGEAQRSTCEAATLCKHYLANSSYLNKEAVDVTFLMAETPKGKGNPKDSWLPIDGISIFPLTQWGKSSL